MSYVDLIPSVRSLSRSDKLLLIQWLAGELAEIDDACDNPTDRVAGPVEGVDAANRDEDQEMAQAAVHAVGLRNTLGRLAEEATSPDLGGINVVRIERTWPFPIEAGQSIPIWLPNESYEAAAIMLKMLEERKAIS